MKTMMKNYAAAANDHGDTDDDGEKHDEEESEVIGLMVMMMRLRMCKLPDLQWGLFCLKWRSAHTIGQNSLQLHTVVWLKRVQ